MTIEFHQARCGWRAVLLAVLVVALGARGAWAHRINVFAATEGRTITGRVYFSGGGRAQDVEVRVLGPGGQSLGRTRTDAEGEFTFEAALRCDHQFVVETDDGHRASYTVGADELPEGLPVAGDPPAEPEAAPSSPQASVAPAPQQAELVEMIDRAVSRQVRPLREQLDAYEQKVRLHDILGGIGYIFGLAGVAFYLMGRARKDREANRPD